MAVGEKDIFPAVVVEVEKYGAESQILPVGTEAGGEARVVKSAVAVVLVQGGELVREVSSHNVEPTISVIVSHPDTHAGHRCTVLVEGTAGWDSNFAECAVMIVVVEQTWRSIASDIDVRPAIVVEVGCGGTHSVRSHRPPVLRYEGHG